MKVPITLLQRIKHKNRDLSQDTTDRIKPSGNKHGHGYSNPPSPEPRVCHTLQEVCPGTIYQDGISRSNNKQCRDDTKLN